MDFEQLHWIYNNILKPIYVDYRNAKKGLPNLIYFPTAKRSGS